MKILFIRFSSIGDIVLTTPVIRCVKNQVHGAKVHFLLKKSFASVLENNPYIDKYFYFEDNINALVETLKEENYDLVIDLQKNFRSFRIKQLLGVKSFSFDKLNIQKWLLVNFKINLLPAVHIVDRYMKSVSSLGVVNDGAGLDYFITDKDEEVISAIPENHRKGYIAWVIGARHSTKRLPFEKMVSIGKKINYPLVLLGDKNDQALGDELRQADNTKFFNACGLFSLNQSAALVKHAKKVITHDTGLMHIAAAFKKDIISVWGNTVPEFGMEPYVGGWVMGQGLEVKGQRAKVKGQRLKVKGHESEVKGQGLEVKGQGARGKGFGIGDKNEEFERSAFESEKTPVDTVLERGSSIILEVKNLPCRPCSKIGFEKCPKGHFRCMKDIDESVFENLHLTNDN